MNFTKSQCPYCGVGCGLKMKPKSSGSDDKWLVSGDSESPSTQGKLCVKGATVCETLKDGRLKEPLYRENLNEEFKEISKELMFQPKKHLDDETTLEILLGSYDLKAKKIHNIMANLDRQVPPPSLS